MLRAPWTSEQIAALNAFQHNGRFHPFTCGTDSGHRVLLATPDGWVCEDCEYRQTWAHEFMAQKVASPGAQEQP